MVRLFEVITVDDEQITNEYSCPLALLTREFFIVPTLDIIAPVSVVHECTTSCKIIQSDSAIRLIEREEVELNQHVYKHDVSNELYCINVYINEINGF